MKEPTGEGVRPWQDIVVVDDLLPLEEQRDLHTFLSSGNWSHGWRSHAGDAIQTFWHRHFAGSLDAAEASASPDVEAELARNAPPVHGLWQRLKHSHFAGHALERCYANGLPYGCDGATHTDSVERGACTAVYYPHAHWDPDWGGETLIFNKDKSDILAAIYPKPNRLLVFPGFVFHVARGVSRACPVMRITLMFKTRLVL
ncbi:2OG-Fe(II) oxygenase [Variovorax sp. GB1P17]|uniref:2OG-Fe(II) oxygenase n=1 Tax=Variovorax sp. GB1P17 TaxID=3443740 RepID=UPI003F472686